MLAFCWYNYSMKLTDNIIKDLSTKAKPYKVADGLGLFLLVTPAGGKLWRMAYRFCGKQQTLALGQYPAVSLATARTQCLKARQLLADGVNPHTPKRRTSAATAQTSDSLQTVMRQWMQDRPLLTKTDTATKQLLAGEVLPVLGNRPVATLLFVDVAKVFLELQQQKTGDFEYTKRERIMSAWDWLIDAIGRGEMSIK